MWKCRVIAVGKMKETHWREAEEAYLLRLRPFARCELIEVAAEALGSTVSPEEAMRREAERILRQIPEGSRVIALDRQGKMMDSPSLARLMEDEAGAGTELCVIIGGTAGLDAGVLAKADYKLSLSPMTFTHEMARIFLLEQLYRAATIAHGKAYHY